MSQFNDVISKLILAHVEALAPGTVLNVSDLILELRLQEVFEKSTRYRTMSILDSKAGKKILNKKRSGKAGYRWKYTRKGEVKTETPNTASTIYSVPVPVTETGRRVMRSVIAVFAKESVLMTLLINTPSATY
jgi:hypothetical protein